MPHTAIVLLLVFSVALGGCRSATRVPPANGVDAGLVREHNVVDRKAVLDWCDREPVVRSTLYVVGITAIGVAVLAYLFLSLSDFSDDDS